MKSLDQYVQECFKIVGAPTATTFCTSACATTAFFPFNVEIVPVLYCPYHKNVWPTLDGSEHDPGVLIAAQSQGVHIINDPRTPCHTNCSTMSLSHEMSKLGLWRPRPAPIAFCPTHKYLHACCGEEKPCGACYACNSGLWCIYRCRGERFASSGEPACPWSGLVLSNVEAPYTKAAPTTLGSPPSTRKARPGPRSGPFTVSDPDPASPGHYASVPAVPAPRKRSSNCNRSYVLAWISEASHVVGNVPHIDSRDIEELITSWHIVSENWPTTLHIAGWVFLLSDLNISRNVVGVTVVRARRGWINALARTTFRKANGAACADAISCHIMQHPIPNYNLTTIKGTLSLFENT